LKFDSNNFNYFNFDEYEIDEVTAEILIDGYRFSMPSIGLESSLISFLMNKTNIADANVWNNYSYDFLFFCGNKKSLTISEIENLVTLFNVDLDSSEQTKIANIVKRFMKIVGYTLVSNGKVIDVKSRLDLETIWKN
jgi:hypothetical protein